jgi:nickel/cobalt transporter (NicO) family protein
MRAIIQTKFRCGVALAAATGALLLFWHIDAALAAKSPFGIATPDSSGNAFGGPLGGLFAWVAFYQSLFYKALTHAFVDLKQRGDAFYSLAGISFLYGVFHAAGPGHGKAVITSYLLVSRQTVRRGIVISFLSAAMQGATAIGVVLIAAVALRATAVGMTRTTDWFEIISYALIAAVGAWLLWSKAIGRGHHHDHHHDHHDNHEPKVHDRPVTGEAHAACNHHAGHGHEHHHGHDDGHEVCGHSHAPDPRLLSKPLTLSRAWAAILAVGVRPCSGAIIVLVFALSQQLLWAGIGSVLAMSLGTFITVSVLAGLAVGAKDFALRVAGFESSTTERIMRGVEICGALLVFLLGVTMLGGALAGGLPGAA